MRPRRSARGPPPPAGRGPAGAIVRLILRAAAATRRGELSDIADGQAALRRVATLVAAGGSPEQIFAAVSDEVRMLVGIDVTTMFRCEADDSLTLLAVRSEEGSPLDKAIG